MPLTLALWLFATLSSSCFLVCFYISDPEDRTWRDYAKAFVVIGLILALVPWLLMPAEESQESKVEKANWIAKGCPMYKSECGSKNPYACEIKAPNEGRVMIDDIAVMAYKTCVKSP